MMRADSAVVRTVPAAPAKVDVTQIEVEGVQRHRPGPLVRRQIFRGDAHHHPRGAKHLVTLCIARVRPAISRWFCRKSVSWRPNRRLAGTHCYPQNVWGVGLERNRPPATLQHQRATLGYSHPAHGKSKEQAAHGTAEHIPNSCSRKHGCRPLGEKALLFVTSAAESQ